MQKLIRWFAIFAGAFALACVVMLDMANLFSLGLASSVILGGLLVCLLGVFAIPLIIFVRPTEARQVGAAMFLAWMIAFLFAGDFAERNGAGSIGRGIEIAGAFLFLPCVAFVAGLILYPAMRRLPLQSFALTLLGLLAGWWVGMLLWSQALPSQILADAEAQARGRPYCIVSEGKAVKRRQDLVGLVGMRMRFQAVHIADGSTMRYLHWSNTLGKFTRFEFYGAEEVERDLPCSPQYGFAVRLSA